MVHILVLKSSDLSDIVEPMQETVTRILAAHECSFDEVTVPTPCEMSVAINMFIESRTYEAVLCLGAMVNKYNSPTHIITYQEVLRNLNDFSSYYNYPIGMGIFYAEVKEGMLKPATLFAADAAEAVCQMVKVMRQLNSLESEHYVRNKKHN